MADLSQWLLLILDDAIATYNHNRENKVGRSMDITEFIDNNLKAILDKHQVDGIIEVPLAKVSVLLDCRTLQKIQEFNERKSSLP